MVVGDGVVWVGAGAVPQRPDVGEPGFACGADRFLGEASVVGVALDPLGAEVRCYHNHAPGVVGLNVDVRRCPEPGDGIAVVMVQDDPAVAARYSRVSDAVAHDGRTKWQVGAIVVLSWVEPDLDAGSVHTGPHVTDVKCDDVEGGWLFFRRNVLPRVDVGAG